MTGSIKANARMKEAVINAVVYRCRCTPETMRHAPGEPCTDPVVEDLGTVSYHNRNPLRYALWWAERHILRRRNERMA